MVHLDWLKCTFTLKWNHFILLENIDLDTNLTRRHHKEISTKKLHCYSCTKSPVKTAQCTCDSPKCVLKNSNENSTEGSLINLL
jgi:hypothetical protein